MKPNFTDSELHFIHYIMEDDRKTWIEKYPKSENFDEILAEYDSINDKLNKWWKEEFGYINAHRILENNKV